MSCTSTDCTRNWLDSSHFSLSSRFYLLWLLLPPYVEIVTFTGKYCSWKRRWSLQERSRRYESLRRKCIDLFPVSTLIQLLRKILRHQMSPSTSGKRLKSLTCHSIPCFSSFGEDWSCKMSWMLIVVLIVPLKRMECLKSTQEAD